MTALDVIALTVGVLGTAFGARCYLELWRWAKQCQNARIVIAHKRKVQLQAPLVEWLAWANQLGKDEASHGRTVYRFANASVSIARIAPAGHPIRRAVSRVRGARKQTKHPVAQAKG